MDYKGDDLMIQHHSKFVRVLTILNNKNPWIKRPRVPAACGCNALIAMRTRGDVDWGVELDEGHLKELKRITAKMVQVMRAGGKLTPMSEDEVIACYRGAKFRRYYRVRGIVPTSKNSTHGWFLKVEKLLKDPEDTHPRVIACIEPNFPVLSLQFGRFTKVTEMKLKSITDWGEDFPPGPLFVKGLNSVERAKRWENAFFELRDYGVVICVVLDGKRWDSHIHKPLIDLMRDMIQKVCIDDEGMLRNIIRWMKKDRRLVSRMKGVNLKAVFKNMVFSGDPDTALGNMILMVAIITTALNHFGVDMSRVRYLNDGDDHGMLCAKSEINKVQAAIEWCVGFGVELKIEDLFELHTPEDLALIEHCQAHPIRVGEGAFVVRRMIRHLKKVMSNALMTLKPDPGLTILCATGWAELLLNAGVPVLQNFALMLVRIAGERRHIELQENDELYHRVVLELRRLGLKSIYEAKPQPILDVSRFDFAEAFGVSVVEQLAMERLFDQMRLQPG